jgi:mercuric reductase
VVTIPDWSAVTSSVVKDALRAMFESEHIGMRWHSFTPDEDRMRTALLRLFAEHGRAPALTELATRAGLRMAEIAPLLASLRRRNIVVLDTTGERMVGAYPFTDRDTGHRVTLNGRAINAMCAVDALGIGAMYGRNVEIDSHGGGCGAPIRITTRDRGRPGRRRASHHRRVAGGPL